jgi:5-methylcytosine-specific restriction endonuclease McrA
MPKLSKGDVTGCFSIIFIFIILSAISNGDSSVFVFFISLIILSIITVKLQKIYESYRNELEAEAYIKYAKTHYPPPPNCPRCDDNTWIYISTSPNDTSVEWKCSYCNKKVYSYSVNNTSNENRLNARQPIPGTVKQNVWRRDQGKCVSCGSQRALEYDHIIPVSKGGSNTERNIQLLCENCNRKKSNKI